MKKGLRMVMVRRIAIAAVLILTVASLGWTTGGSEETNLGNEPAEVSWYYPAFGGQQLDQELVEEALNWQVGEQIGGTVTLYPVDPGAYEQRMQAMTASGEEHDIVWTASWFNNYWQNVFAGAFLPLDSLLEEFGSGIRSNIPQKYLEAARVEGSIYGILSYQIIPVTEGFWANQELLDMGGLEAEEISRPWSVEDLRVLDPALEAWKVKYPSTYPVHLDPTGAFDKLVNVLNLDIVQAPAAVYLDDESLSVFNLYASPEYEAFIRTMRDWYVNGWIAEDIVTGAVESRWDQGATGMFFDGNIKPLGTVPDTPFEFSRIRISEPVLSTGGATSTLNAISQSSDSPEAAMRLLNLVNSSPEVFNLLANGIEGTHYEKLDGDMMRRIPDSGYSPNIDWVFGNQFLAYIQEGVNPNIWEETIAINEAAVPTKTLGFVFDPDAVSVELSNANSVISEFANVLQTGSVDVDSTYPVFLDRLGQAGVDAIVDEVQRQLDEWQSTK